MNSGETGAPWKSSNDQRARYSSASLVKRSRDDARSLLHKLFDTWNRLRQSGEENIEIWLVSNWASGEDLGKFIHDTYTTIEQPTVLYDTHRRT